MQTEDQMIDIADEQTFADMIEADDKPAKEEPAKQVQAAEETDDADEADVSEDDVVDDEAAEDGEDPDGSEGEEQPITLVEWTDDNGKVWQIPEDITPSLLKNKDYTVKTQQVAEERKALEDAKAAFEAEQKRTNEDLQIEAELARLQSIAEQYDQLDWDRLSQEDLYDAQQKQFQRGLVREQMQKLAATRQERQAARQAEMQKSVQERFQAVEQYARTNIPGWDQGKEDEIVNFAREVGFTDQSLRQNLDVALMKTLHLAFLGKQANERAKAAMKPQTNGVKPTGKVTSGKSSTTTNPKNLADAPIDAYLAARKRGADPRLSDL